jgi:hypothetical protein
MIYLAYTLVRTKMMERRSFNAQHLRGCQPERNVFNSAALKSANPTDKWLRILSNARFRWWLYWNFEFCQPRVSRLWWYLHWIPSSVIRQLEWQLHWVSEFCHQRGDQFRWWWNWIFELCVQGDSRILHYLYTIFLSLIRQIGLIIIKLNLWVLSSERWYNLMAVTLSIWLHLLEGL